MPSATHQSQVISSRGAVRGFLIVGACLLSFLVYFFTGLAGAEIVLLKLYQPYHRVVGLGIYLLMAVPVCILLRSLAARFGPPAKGFVRVTVMSAMVAFGTPATAGPLFNPDKELGVLAGFERIVLDAWMPAHRVFIEVFGNFRFTFREGHFVTPDRLRDLQKDLRPGDLLFMRKDYYLSNIFIAGYWKHAAVYVGSLEELDRLSGGDRPFSEALRQDHPGVYRTLKSAQERGGGLIVESVTQGVLIRPLLESVHADSLAVVRPHLPPRALREILISAIGRVGSAYDFRFDYATNDALYCSEFVCKAFEASDGTDRSPFRLETVSGREVVDPSGMIRALAESGEFRQGRSELITFWMSDALSGQALPKNLAEFIATVGAIAH